MAEYSNLFVVLMGMGIVFFGLVCIIILTTLMGMIMTRMESCPAGEAALADVSGLLEKSAPQIDKKTMVVVLTAMNQAVGSPYNVVDIQKL